MIVINGKTNQLIGRHSAKDKYFTEVPLDHMDKNNSLVIISELIQPGTVVLDVGCGQGKFGKLISDMKCAVFGIEIDPFMVQMALQTQCYKDVFHMNLEHPDMDSDDYHRYEKLGAFDYIVFGDVLEHLVDPTKVILNICSKLKMGGKALASIPNVAHSDVTLNLLNGTFNYYENGILDYTHLRFFTKQSFVEWICDINNYQSTIKFDCRYCGNTQYNTDYLMAIKDNHPHLHQIISQNPNSISLQHIFELRRIPSEDNPFALNDLLSCHTDDVLSTLEHNFNQLKEAKERMDSLNRIITQLKIENIQLEKHLKEQEHQGDLLHAEINALKKTLSWKITKPLRFIRHLLR